MSTVAIVDSFLSQAVKQGASDIHVESIPEGLRVRLRIDGLLEDFQHVSLDSALPVIARIKVLARLDVAEKRIPQDGKLSCLAAGVNLDVRVATFPGLYGEKVVLRLLERSSKHKSLSEIGLSPKLHAELLLLIQRTHGFFLVTGPTGAGKTTSLYAALHAIQSHQKNVVTLEDPIEYTIQGITQGQIQPEIGFTFARGIRALLRQDPDIIMVGEVRDRETAETAIQAALTGHVVLSTLHTNDAPGALMRLLDMGIPAFLINATLTGVLAQRLVRILCPSCRYEERPTGADLDFLNYVGITLQRAYKAGGCSLCQGRGYKGRTGIFELLVISSRLRELVSEQASYDIIYQHAMLDGMISLKQDAATKIELGITSIAELARVVC